MPNFYEFFAGGGMAFAALREGWTCTFANDFSKMKAKVYRDNWGEKHFHYGDVGAIETSKLPGHPALVWASTPCQDLSLAGNAVGLGKPGELDTRSGAFWPWWNLVQRMAAEGRKPPVVVFENVVGALSSNKGADFEIVARAFSDAGYVFGALVIDAIHFLPQSRPRLFVVGFDKDVAIPPAVRMLGPQTPWHPKSVQNAFDRLPDDVREAWAWWALPLPLVRRAKLDTMIEEEPTGTRWHTAAETKKLVAMMSPANKAKLHQAQAVKRRLVGTVYKRTRSELQKTPAPKQGTKPKKAKLACKKKVVRAEVRFDGIAGCLRTPSGGSSRQTVIVVDGDRIRTRLLSTREAARLMGLGEKYVLPTNYNDAYHVCGDGVAVPVVSFLAQHLLKPLALAQELSLAQGEAA